MQLLKKKKKTVKSAKMNKIFELLSCSQGAIASLKLFGHVTATTRPKCALHMETTCVLGFRARSKPCIFAWKCSEHEDMRRSTVTMTCTSEIVTFRFSRLYPSFPKTMSSRVSLTPKISPNNSLQHSWKGMVGEGGGGGGGVGRKSLHMFWLRSRSIYDVEFSFMGPNRQNRLLRREQA